MQSNKEHIRNVQSIPLVVSVSIASLTGALSHWQSASAGTGKSAFLLHLYLPHFIKQSFSGDLQLLSRPRSYRMNVPTHDEDVVLK
jgi:hypothetical protein